MYCNFNRLCSYLNIIKKLLNKRRMGQSSRMVNVDFCRKYDLEFLMTDETTAGYCS